VGRRRNARGGQRKQATALAGRGGGGLFGAVQ
jgi:hypothetical protein